MGAMMGNPGLGRPVTRRELLQVGSIGAIGLALPELLWAQAASARKGRDRAAETSCIFIVQYGGASHIDSFDLKPDAPAELRGPTNRYLPASPACRLANSCRDLLDWPTATV